MRPLGAAFLLALGVSLARSCPGMDHDHGLAPRSQRGSTQPSGGKSLVRPLTWGQINVVHTTDIHGWYQGHLAASQPEPNYSGDWGDFASFVAHLRKQAASKGVDLLVVDSGDLHDGAGFSDAPPSGQVAGQVADDFHLMVNYDLMSVGNHELYNYTIALNTFTHLVPHTNGRYMASNVNITLPSGQEVPMGKRFVKFRTPLGRRVTSLGVLFNFKDAGKGLKVQTVQDMVEEQWFAEAIKDQPDVFVLIGHMPVRRDNWPVVVEVIRKSHPTTPILILGGHTHIRDCVVYDAHSVGLESGRYMETIGWLSANSTSWPTPRGAFADDRIQAKENANASQKSDLSFSRTYIDANRRNYAIHAGLNEQSLDTVQGLNISHAMDYIATKWNLNHVIGTAPQDYILDGYGLDDSRSLLHLLTSHVMPSIVSTNDPARHGTPNIVLANSGSQRFSIYRGNFTKNDQYIVSPFIDTFLYIPEVEWQYASQLVGQLNGQYGAYSRRSSVQDGAYLETEASYEDVYSSYGQGDVDSIYNSWRREQAQYQNLTAQADLAALDVHVDTHQAPLASLHQDQGSELQGAIDSGPTLGYVTHDSCSGPGDDTVHLAMPYSDQPDYVQSPPTGNSTTLRPQDRVDVIFLDFVEKSILEILNKLQSDKAYSPADVAPYGSDLTTQELYPLYAQRYWSA